MKAIVTVIGKDQVGITAAVCSLLAQHSINILDISQTILQEYFTMVMLVDTTACDGTITQKLKPTNCKLERSLHKTAQISLVCKRTCIL